MHSAIPHLIELQRVDHLIVSVRVEIETFPKRVKDADAKLSGARAALATAKDGLAPGDQVTLLRDGGTDANGNVVGDEDVGMAQITRVTPYGASAVLLRQTGPTIGVGTRVRVTAKMP